MNVCANQPAKIDLNDHGGVTLKFEEFMISNTIGGKWSITFKGKNIVCDSIYRCFYVATKELKLRP
jgi:hypothetical protein